MPKLHSSSGMTRSSAHNADSDEEKSVDSDQEEAGEGIALKSLT